MAVGRNAFKHSNGYSGVNPGPKSKRVIARDMNVISSSVSPREDGPMVYERGLGSWAWDVDGKKYLDFASGIGVNALGHRHPAVQKAVEKQVRKAWHIGFTDFYAEAPVTYAEMLCGELGKPFDSVFFSNSGAESIECALKMCRHHTGKEKFAAFHKDNFIGVYKKVQQDEIIAKPEFVFN